MRSMIIFALVLVACASISDAGHYMKREAVADDATAVAHHDSKEKSISKEDSKEEEKHDHSKEKYEGADLAEDSFEMSEKDYVAIIGIFIDPASQRTRVMSRAVPPSALTALL